VIVLEGEEKRGGRKEGGKGKRGSEESKGIE